MELRQLTTDRERQIFSDCLAKARATGGAIGLRETPRSQLGRTHLMFGNVYAIFENEGEPPERMVAGFIVHDLGTLPQSFPKPDLGHLPPKSVIEGGELWSLLKGAAGIAKRIAPAVAGLLQAKAIILYPVVRPIDVTAPHAQLNFVNACEPLRNPFGETLDGEELWVQPMILEGENLEEYIRRGFDFLFRVDGGRQAIRFDASIAKRVPHLEASMPRHEEERRDPSAPCNPRPPEGNGTAPAN
ncbi:MAG: hypothetical protein ACHQZS_06100 [Candidatus Binatales bacterium]